MSDEEHKEHQARESERKKTEEQRAEDYAYTLNHAISCGITDIWVQGPISNAVTKSARSGHGPINKTSKFLERFFEKEHHKPSFSRWVHETAEHGKGLGRRTAKLFKPFVKDHANHGLRDWFIGEAAGDFGAVPLTVLTQRLVPGLMEGGRAILEPLMGWAFRMGAKRDAKHWANKNGFALDAPETKAKEKTIYEHEMRHLPKVLVWNAWSIPINLLVQKYVMKSPNSWPELLIGKTFGSVFSNGVLLGGRSTLPDAFIGWDKFNSKHIIGPTTKVVGGLFGVNSDALKRVQEREEELNGPAKRKYEGRLETPPAKEI